MQLGQINRGSILGEKIFNLAKQSDVNTIVEIGTWNGLGSTKCIYDAVIGTRKNVWSLECNKIRHEQAKVNLGFIPPTFKLLNGTVVDAKDLEPMMKDLPDGQQEWLKEDLNWIRQIPNVFNNLPEKIDMLIIDGGEFSGLIEFELLADRSKYIILDDTNATKHIKTRELINNDNKFKVINDNTYERNGFMICENLQF